MSDTDMVTDIVIGLVTSLVALVAAIIAYATVAPVTGIWRRDQETAEEDYLLLEQLGPFVSGKRNVDGGNHLYVGWQLFNHIRLVRRDFGIPALIAQGFPSVIAKKINGTVVGKLRLTRRGPKRLVGWFTPQKILFDEPSARVLSRHYQSAIPRSYRRTDMSELPVLKGPGVRSANLPPPVPASKKRRTTF